MLHLLMDWLHSLIFGVTFGLFGGLYIIARALLPANASLVYREEYPYPNGLTRAQLNIANWAWSRMLYHQRAEFVWHNTYIFLPNQPGNPYRIVNT